MIKNILEVIIEAGSDVHKKYTEALTAGVIFIKLFSGLLSRGLLYVDLNLSTAAEAVSYTHLDVYKRQIFFPCS